MDPTYNKIKACILDEWGVLHPYNPYMIIYVFNSLHTSIHVHICSVIPYVHDIPWAPKAMKHKGFGHLKTKVILKNTNHVGLGGPMAYYMYTTCDAEIRPWIHTPKATLMVRNWSWPLGPSGGRFIGLTRWAQKPFEQSWVVVSNMFYFHPYLGKW